MQNDNTRNPLCILIAAMGGEGGGVLMNWIVNASVKKGFPVQATSIPGVAQRTGATTYYVEVWPERTPSGDEKKPIFSLSPAIGEVDIMVATELAEGARALRNGFITSERTTLIASTHRVFLTIEKMAMGDGRLNEDDLLVALKKHSKANVLFNASKVAQEHGTIINAVLLGALVATNAIPIEKEFFVSAIEMEGKAIKANLEGFEAGFQINSASSGSKDRVEKETGFGPDIPQSLKDKVRDIFPKETHDTINHGINRLIDYQNLSYAKLYLARLEIFKDSDNQLCREVAKHLAVRMSFEDIMRVAQAKIRINRFKRIEKEIGAKDGDPIEITEFFKPGIREFCDMLPPSLSQLILSWVDKKGLHNKLYWAQKIRSTTVTGFLKIWLLSRLRWWRPRTYRWKIEQTSIEKWLSLIKSASSKNVDLAMEIAELSRLIKGYGATHLRGTSNFNAIVEQLIQPPLRNNRITENIGPTVRAAREAALSDPDGKSLQTLLSKSVNTTANIT